LTPRPASAWWLTSETVHLLVWCIQNNRPVYRL
jgi:hypothetical protein